MWVWVWEGVCVGGCVGSVGGVVVGVNIVVVGLRMSASWKISRMKLEKGKSSH